MSDGFLILHGLESLRPPEHWHHWLAKRLGDRGLAVAYPQLPEPYEPQPEEWRDAVLASLSSLPSSPVIVCHSLSCLLWVRMAAAGDLPPCERVLLVSPPHDDRLPANGTSFAVGARDLSAIAQAPRVVCGTEDDYVPGGPPAWAAEIGADVDVLAGAGHLNPDDGHGPWPSVERWCLDPGERLAP